MCLYLKFRNFMAILMCIITSGNVFAGLLNFTRAGDVDMIKNDHHK